MASFEKNVVTIAVIILVVALVSIGLAMKYSTTSVAFPPSVSDCPDYWLYTNRSDPSSLLSDVRDISGTIASDIAARKAETTGCPVPANSDSNDNLSSLFGSSSGTGKCVNTHGLGLDTCKKIMDFSTEEYSGTQGLCNKQTWANNCNITWDGVTNAEEACGQTGKLA